MDEDIDIERLKEVIQLANLEDFINSLPQKLYTAIGNTGRGISQGQKQRILIARALYKNPNFVFLDEATNSLDAKNEREVTESLLHVLKQRTGLVIAHRLSTIKMADQIIVMSCGCIVEQGTHASLIKTQGAYYNLVKNQLELEQL
jgi:ATP-binding cassette subfamily B protein